MVGFGPANARKFVSPKNGVYNSQIKSGNLAGLKKNKIYCMLGRVIHVVRPVPFERSHHREHTGILFGPKYFTKLSEMIIHSHSNF